MQEAALRDVHDLNAALELANVTAPRAAAAASALGRLVEAMIKLKSLNGVIVHKEGFALLMPGNVGMHVMRQGNAATRESLQKKIQGYITQLCKDGILPQSCAGGLSEDSPKYLEGLAEVRADVVRCYRFQVEEQVVKRNQILRSLEEAEGSKNAQKNRKSLTRSGKNIADLLRTLSTWEVYGTDREPTWEATEATIRNVYEGKFPWSAEIQSSGAPEAVQRHFGVRYRTAAAQVQRAEEEKVYLSMEVVRLFDGVEGRIKVVDDHVQVLAVEAGACAAAGGGVAARRARVLAGKIKLAGLERDRLEMIRADAEAKLLAHLP